MDHYNEQLVEKYTDTKDTLKRVGIGLGFILITVISVFGMAFVGPVLLLVPIGGGYLAYVLFTNTFVEYEYIVTNNELDIDKIVGRRKRKRLITVELNSVSKWGEYGGDVIAADTTVIAADGRGRNDRYLVAQHEKYGKVAVIFTPSEETLVNINFAVPYSVKNNELTAKGKEKDEQEAFEVQEVKEETEDKSDTE